MTPDAGADETPQEGASAGTDVDDAAATTNADEIFGDIAAGAGDDDQDEGASDQPGG